MLVLTRKVDETIKIGDDIDIMVAEDFVTTYDFENKKYLWQPKEEVDRSLKMLKEAKKRNPNLKFFAVDYWYPDQPKVIKKIYRMDRESGLDPYVGIIDLDVIVPEPK